MDEHGRPGRCTASATRRLRATKSAGSVPLVTSHRHWSSSWDADSLYRPLGHGGTGASCSIRTAAPAAAHACADVTDGSPEAAERPPPEGGECEHGWLPPQDLGRRDRCPGHRLDLDVDARLIGVDLEEHVADAQRRALAVGDEDRDLVWAVGPRRALRFGFHGRRLGERGVLVDRRSDHATSAARGSARPDQARNRTDLTRAPVVMQRSRPLAYTARGRRESQRFRRDLSQSSRVQPRSRPPTPLACAAPLGSGVRRDPGSVGMSSARGSAPPRSNRLH